MPSTPRVRDKISRSLTAAATSARRAFVLAHALFALPCPHTREEKIVFFPRPSSQGRRCTNSSGTILQGGLRRNHVYRLIINENHVRGCLRFIRYNKHHVGFPTEIRGRRDGHDTCPRYSYVNCPLTSSLIRFQIYVRPRSSVVSQRMIDKTQKL